MRKVLLEEVAAQFPEGVLLRVYWYDGPDRTGKKTSDQQNIDKLDDFKLRLGTRNSQGEQKAVDGLILTDMMSLAQARAITDALLVSGDADMIPALIAAQNLGLRVHLLIVGSEFATSPHLMAEADQKVFWDMKRISDFAKPVPPPPNLLREPVPVATYLDDVQMATSRIESNTDAINAGPAISNDIEWAAIARKVYAGLSADVRAMLQSVKGNRMRLPETVDAVLLRTGAAAAERRLEEAEKRLLRNEFRKLL